jgi:hypothetical protein
VREKIKRRTIENFNNSTSEFRTFLEKKNSDRERERRFLGIERSE